MNTLALHAVTESVSVGTYITPNLISRIRSLALMNFKFTKKHSEIVFSSFHKNFVSLDLEECVIDLAYLEQYC